MSSLALHREARRVRTYSNLEILTQLMEHNLATLETASARIEYMRRVLTTSNSEYGNWCYSLSCLSVCRVRRGGEQYG